MTRWARAGSAQKHKKMPGDATKWGEFDFPQTSNRNRSKQQTKIKRKHDINHHGKPSLATDFSARKVDSSKMSKQIGKPQESCFSQNAKIAKKFKSGNGIHRNEMTPRSDFKVSTIQDEINNQEKSSLTQNVSLKKLKYKKRKASKQNDVHDKSSELPISKIFEKKKGMYMEKLKKRRTENGILLLPSKVERKLYNIKRRLREKGLPPAMIKDIIRKERRNEELKFRKTFNPSKLCFNCRQAGHVLADCPEKIGSSNQETGICFKCGSAEHTSFKCPENIQGFPFAKCFVCKETGHISKDCPKNKHGVYPKGGRCNLCGNVNHLKRDCPSLSKKKDEESTITLDTVNENTSIDAEVLERSYAKKEKVKRKNCQVLNLYVYKVY